MAIKKSGSVDWTMGKLMAIVLAIVFLVIIVLGWSSAVKPLHERAAGMLDGVLLFFVNIWDGGGDDNGAYCFEKDVVIDGVGKGVATYCKENRKEYREVNLSESVKWVKVDVDYFRSDYGGFSFGRDDLLFGLDEKYVIYNKISDFYFERDLFNFYVEANEKYEEVYVGNEGSSDVDKRAEFFIYVKVGSDEYRWAEDLKAWEKCESSESCYFKEQSPVKEWYKNISGSWEQVGSTDFEYIKDKIKYGVFDFSFRIDSVADDKYSDWSYKGGDSFEFLKEKRIDAKVLYGEALGDEFIKLLEESYLDDGRFDSMSIEAVDMLSILHSPELIFDVSGKRYKIGRVSNEEKPDFVLMKSASDGSFSELGYMDSLRLDDEEFEKVVVVNRVRKFLEEED